MASLAEGDYNFHPDINHYVRERSKNKFFKELYGYSWNPDDLVGKQMVVSLDSTNFGSLEKVLAAYTSYDVEATRYLMEGIRKMYNTDNTNISYVDDLVGSELEKRRAKKLLERKLALVDEYGDDEFSNGTVLHFKKRFDRGGIEYEYAALKANGSWHTTGKKNFGAGTWEQLVLALVSGEFPVEPGAVMVCEDHMSGEPNSGSITEYKEANVGETQTYGEDKDVSSYRED